MLFGLSGIDQRRFGPYGHEFFEGLKLGGSLKKTPAVGASDAVAVSLFVHEDFDLMDAGFMIHLQPRLKVAFLRMEGGGTILEDFKKVGHSPPKGVSAGVMGQRLIEGDADILVQAAPKYVLVHPGISVLPSGRSALILFLM
jgi:hypothetical protein